MADSGLVFKHLGPCRTNLRAACGFVQPVIEYGQLAISPTKQWRQNAIDIAKGLHEMEILALDGIQLSQ
jgi:hypothetical protein